MNTKQALGEVRKFARFIKAFEHIEAVADELAKADQLISEREKQLTDLSESIDQAKSTLAELEEQANLCVQATVEERDRAQEDYNTVLAGANKKAAEIGADAEARLTNLVDDQELEGRVLRELRKKITSANAELAAILPRLEEVRAQARKIVGGG